MNIRATARDLAIDAFPTRFAVQVRYSDLDTLRHIGNQAVMALIAEGRTRFLRETIVDRAKPAGASYMVGQSATMFVRQAYYPTECWVGCGILNVGRHSFRVVQALFQEDMCRAIAESVIVAVRGDVAAELTPELATALGSFVVSSSTIPQQLIR